ncbi:MAG TPA: LeuA family protein [Myxococcota bacterium]|jgi:2-isopropylmalate synthase|nr:LeuA family protein [Myxococcota bacterium]
MPTPPLPQESDYIFDWNAAEKTRPVARGPFYFFDETLRDGIQSPSVRDPKIEDKIRLIHLLDALGVHHVDIGLPGAGPRAVEDCLVLAREIVNARLRIKPACAARTHPSDINPIIDVSQRAGVAIEVMTFIGSSPIRLYAEEWTLDLMLERSAAAVDLAVKAGLPCTYVTEDTTRAHPTALDKLFRNAIAHGAYRLCLCDTVGHATPDGVINLVRWTRDLVRATGADVQLDWHGHNDRGLAVANSIYALEAGANRVHGTVLGVGERVGNAAIDQILLNLKLLGEIDNDLTKLLELCETGARAMGWDIAKNYPLAGSDAFRTATGVHAAAVIKAMKKGDAWLADRIYSGVPAGLFGKKQEIEIGFMSGKANVQFWLQQHGFVPEPALVDHVFDLAKRSDHILGDAEVRAAVDEFARAPGGRAAAAAGEAAPASGAEVSAPHK